MAERRRPAEDEAEPPALGVGVDPRGGDFANPTKNVLDLVKAESKKRDELRDADKELVDAKIGAVESLQGAMRTAGEKFQDFARETEARLQSLLSDAESTRVNQLAELRQVYETRIAEMLSKSVESTSTLVSTQLVQIQATFNERVSKLEEFRWATAGRSSVADPALADAMNKMAQSISSLNSTNADALSAMATANTQAMDKLMGIATANRSSITDLQETEALQKGRGGGRSDVVGWIVAGITAAVAIGGLIITLAK